MIDNDPGDEWVSQMYGFVPLPDRMSSEDVEKALRGAAGDLEQITQPTNESEHSAPCDEERDDIARIARECREKADMYEQIRKDRAG